jgi:hypothetical protein
MIDDFSAGDDVVVYRGDSQVRGVVIGATLRTRFGEEQKYDVLVNGVSLEVCASGMRKNGKLLW